MPMKMPVPPSGTTVGTYETYEQAQRAVDFLSDEGFPVQHVTIVGNGLRMVERVTGRFDRNRAAATGAAGGAWWGLFVGAVLALFASESNNWLLLVVMTVIAGAVFGAVMGIIGYAMTGGKRDFTSTSSVVATTYDVLCQYQHAEEAQNLLTKLAWRG
ncbi:MAG TPA: general stress protein [Nocardioidaceae bacterium]|jgi:hypothetical protein|nr:general stress protein [Nocardioidaceae bacterium]